MRSSPYQWQSLSQIWHPILYCWQSFGISHTAISYTGMSSSNIFPLSHTVLGCSIHFARLVAHVTPLPAKRPSIYSVQYSVWVEPVPYRWTFWGIWFTTMNCSATTIYSTVDSPRVYPCKTSGCSRHLLAYQGFLTPHNWSLWRTHWHLCMSCLCTIRKILIAENR
jgi:hypothetical protein